jgi:hypothetical protein
MRFVRKAQVMHQELDRGARDRNGAFESVDRLAVHHPESVKGQMLGRSEGGYAPKYSHSCLCDLKRVAGVTYRQAHAAEIVRNRRQESVLTYNRLLTDVVEHKASGPICVLGSPRRKAILSNECGRLVTKAACDPGPGQRASCELAVCFWVRARHDLWQAELLRIKLEEPE